MIEATKSSAEPDMAFSFGRDLIRVMRSNA